MTESSRPTVNNIIINRKCNYNNIVSVLCKLGTSVAVQPSEELRCFSLQT